MAKLLRQNEKISFLQTRAPTPLWRYIKSVAISHATDGTATRLCTDHMLEYLEGRLWAGGQWMQPQREHIVGGKSGFQQVNLPLSNMDDDGKIIVSASYLKKHQLLSLVDADKAAYKDMLETADFSRAVYRVAAQLEVSGATFGYTFLNWLATVKFASKG